MNILKKIIIGVLVFFVVLGLVGFFIAPPIVKSLAVDKLSAALHRKVSVEKIRINPYALSVTVRGCSLEDPGRIFITEPKTLVPEKKEKIKDSRVNFKLK